MFTTANPMKARCFNFNWELAASLTTTVNLSSPSITRDCAVTGTLSPEIVNCEKTVHSMPLDIRFKSLDLFALTVKVSPAWNVGCLSSKHTILVSWSTHWHSGKTLLSHKLGNVTRIEMVLWVIHPRKISVKFTFIPFISVLLSGKFSSWRRESGGIVLQSRPDWCPTANGSESNTGAAALV